MSYFFQSIATRSFWKYALATPAALTRIFSIVGVLWTFIELLDFFQIYERTQYSKFAFFFIIAFAILIGIAWVRPVNRISYKLPGQDLRIEVRIGDILDANGEIVISSSTTFDTDIAGGIIAANSLQGQFATRFFQGKTQDIDLQLGQSLQGVANKPKTNPIGKTVEYPIGTIATVKSHGNNYYFLAMSEFNPQGNATSNLKFIDISLENLWAHLIAQGNFEAICLPLLGTGRGRIPIPRKKMIERIAQSFVDASKNSNFSNNLIIYVHPLDAARFDLNLFEVKDYLVRSLHG